MKVEFPQIFHISLFTQLDLWYDFLITNGQQRETFWNIPRTATDVLETKQKVGKFIKNTVNYLQQRLLCHYICCPLDQEEFKPLNCTCIVTIRESESNVLIKYSIYAPVISSLPFDFYNKRADWLKP